MLLQGEVLQLSSYPVIGRPDGPPGLFAVVYSNWRHLKDCKMKVRGASAQRIRPLLQSWDTASSPTLPTIRREASRGHSINCLPRNGESLRVQCRKLPPVVVDRVLLQHVILNLIINTMEAMRTIVIGCGSCAFEHRSSISGSIVVRVQDSGVGIDLEHLSRMFEAFYTTKVQGIGMGLTISRSIIEAHGGRLWAVANNGPGSTFCFRLPIAAGGKM